MNILQINTLDNVGGAAKVAYRLKARLEEMGHVTSMFVRLKQTNDKNVFIMPRPKWRHFLARLFSTDINFYDTDFIMNTPEFKKADVIHCHNLHGYYFNLNTLKKMSKLKPVVWTLHDLWSVTSHCAYPYGCHLRNGFYDCPSLNTPPGILWHNENYLQKTKAKIYKDMNLHIVAPAIWLKDMLKGSVLENKDIKLIYNGVDIGKFKASDKVLAREKLKLPQDKKIILFLSNGGKNNSQKGWQYTENLVKQYKERKDVYFVCAGNDEVGLQQDNIKYVNYLKDEEECALYYSAADVFLLTSLAETFPLVVLEAMACGLPVVSFDVGGVKEAVVHKVQGYVVKYKDETDLVSGIDFVLGLGQNQYEKMRVDAAQMTREKFGLEEMVSNYLSLYRSLIKQ